MTTSSVLLVVIFHASFDAGYTKSQIHHLVRTPWGIRSLPPRPL
ncbi:MAG TPA: hypothetical protein VKB85_16570 [Propionibacteriaceae bacterium]|nr:hypothetical protein [Propionibacteriaceae bacterium]